MRISLVYTKAGNGHYIPAKNLYESFLKLGINASLIDFHKDILNNPKASEMELKCWRFMSKFPHIQRFLAFIPQRIPIIKDLLYEIDKTKRKLLRKHLRHISKVCVNSKKEVESQ